MPVITISGHRGSSVREIAHEVAGYLELPLFDEEFLFQGVAERLEVSLEKLGELILVPFKFLDRILYDLDRTAGRAPGIGSAGGVAIYAHSYDPPVDAWRFCRAIEQTAHQLAATGSMVLLGPAIHAVLKDHPRAFHVFTTAPLEARIRRVMEQEEISEVEARRKVEAADGHHRAFLRRYFKANAEDLRHYDLVINTDKTPVEAAVRSIAHLAQGMA